MKVLCINTGYKNPYCEIKDNSYIKEGEIYTVIGEHSGYSTHVKQIIYVYELEEVDGYYEKGLFVPISDIDEIEMIREYNLQKV